MLRDNVLRLLEQHRGQVVTGGEIARSVGVSRTAVWKAVRSLRESGNEIESLAGAGYRLSANSDGLSVGEITNLLTTEFVGRSLEVLSTVPSTNGYIENLNPSSLPEGYTVIADGQTEGRGRKGRAFHSPSREGVYLSALLKPRVQMEDIHQMTICAAVAVCRALESACGIKAEIKWVNDIYCGGRKLCGILTEASVSAEDGSVGHVTVGVGVNTGIAPKEVADTAASVYGITGARGLRNRLAAAILNHLEGVYLDFTRNGLWRATLDAYAKRMFITGRMVEIQGPDGPHEARVRGLDEHGCLLAERGNGELCRVKNEGIKLL